MCYTRISVGFGSMLLLLATTSLGQQVYKSVDADGNVTYSTSPPADVLEQRVRPMRLDPGPTSEQQREAQRRASALSSEAQSAERRQRSAAEQRRESAERDDALKESQRELEEVEGAYRSDWRSLLRTGLEPDPELTRRRDEAQQQVRELEDGRQRGR